MKPQLIVFDLDGTLVHFPFNHLFTTAERVLAELGFGGVARAELEQSFADFEFFRVVAEASRLQFTEALAAALQWDGYPPVELFPYTIGCLQSLKAAGYRMALATSRDSPHEELAVHLEHTGLVEHFEHLSTRRDASLDWSDKGPQLKEISILTGLPTGLIAMCGDNPRDISSAKQAGVQMTAALESGGIKAEVLSREAPHWLFPSLVEFTDCLIRL